MEIYRVADFQITARLLSGKNLKSDIINLSNFKIVSNNFVFKIIEIKMLFKLDMN